MPRLVPLLLLFASLARAADYTGSGACRTCHPAVYARWAKTRMANVIRDPQKSPAAILGDFAKPNPLVTFRPADIAFVYGDKWKQRYFYKLGNDYFVYPAQWDIQNRVWRAYHPAKGTDWWTAYYPDDQSERPTGPLCDGCHSVGYNTATHEVVEWNVGCEKCHGPGGDHVKRPSRANVVNPARLDFVRAGDVCLQCHTQGRPLKNPVDGRFYDWPVGYTPGDRLADFWQLEEHKPGETTFTHLPDGTAHKNRMQGNDFAQSQMYKKGIPCFACHDVHGTDNNADLTKPASLVCVTCHGNMPGHSHHAANGEGADCAGCHMPKIEQTIANVNVRAHTFRVGTASCIACHRDKDAGWATKVLRSWPNFSPWRFE